MGILLTREYTTGICGLLDETRMVSELPGLWLMLSWPLTNTSQVTPTTSVGPLNAKMCG
jgi:hypothetical protein